MLACRFFFGDGFFGDAGWFTGETAGEASNALFRGAVGQTGEAIALVVQIRTSRARLTVITIMTNIDASVVLHAVTGVPAPELHRPA